jgi:GNAT superfamily N-acetyltransferase
MDVNVQPNASEQPAPFFFLTASLATARGDQLRLRPLAATDAPILGRYFLGLSERTKRQFGPHPFDQATADLLCATLAPPHLLRMIAVINGDAGEQVIAYFILVLTLSEDTLRHYTERGVPLDPQTDCLVAPSVADIWQSRGVGRMLIRQIMQYARRLGQRRMVLLGGVYFTNTDAFRFYQTMGFHIVGSFANAAGAMSYDMICDLDTLN